MKTLQADMQRLKGYFPFRIIWGAINPLSGEVVTGANVTKRQANDYIRKGWEVYVLN
jgi:hypothetical protein